MLSRAWFGAFIVASAGCAPTPYITTERDPGHQVRRWPSSLSLRTPDAQYWVAFEHTEATHSHAALISTDATATRLVKLEPSWLVLEIDGQRTEFTRWSTRSQSDLTAYGPLTCYGETPPQCKRDPARGDHWTWKYVLPAPAVAALSRVKKARITLGLGTSSVYQELQPDEAEWLSAFFAETQQRRPSASH